MYTYFALRKSEIPFVSTSHNWLDNDRRARCYGRIDRFVLRRLCTGSSGFRRGVAKTCGLGIDPQRTSIITNGIDLRPYAGVQANLKSELDWDGSPLVGLVGRLSPEKGVDIFFQAASLILSAIPNAKFIVVGDGPDRARLDSTHQRALHYRERATSWDIEPTCLVCMLHWTFWCVHPARKACLSAILEAMASRLPVVATTVWSVAEDHPA